MTFQPRHAIVMAVAGTAALLAGFVPAAAAASPGPGASPSGAAPGGPGAQSYLGTARKDCFGTALSTTSKAWYTVADGVLSDVYGPGREHRGDRGGPAQGVQ